MMDNPFLKNKSAADIDLFALEVIDTAYINGIIMRNKDKADSADVASYAPFTLFPSPFSKVHFLQARDIQQSFNLLMHKVAHDYDFLKEALQSVIKVDDFTRNLWEIYEKIQAEGISQPLWLSLNRSDYMIDCLVPADDILSGKSTVDRSLFRLRQVEFNTISASFSGLSERLSLLHRHVAACQQPTLNVSDHCPSNKAADGMAEALLFAWKHYNQPESAILILVYKTERNIFDHRWIEFHIKQREPRVKVIRHTLDDITDQGHLTEDKRLIVNGVEVAIVYQRFGYMPDDFKREKDWNTRLMIERSMAIKCPTIAYHLAGAKKVQQVLALPGVVERFIDDPTVQRQIRDTFAGLYSLDLNSKEGDEAVNLALKEPHRFVLKPQREGGGNNTYGDAIRSVLTPIQNSVERTGYILMERIHPVPFENIVLRPGNKPEHHYMVSELGVYGALVGTKETVMLNSQIGYLLRSKAVGIDEGGVATGFAALDSPFLV